MGDLNLYEIIGFILFIIICIYTFKEFRITLVVEQLKLIRPTRESLKRKVRKRKEHLIRSIQNGIIKFTKDEYLDCRVPLGIASEARFKNNNLREMWNYTIEFENDKFKIEFIAQIRANMVIIKPVGKKKKEILSFVDQTLQHPDIFHGPHDIKCKCSAAKLRSILNYVDEIRDQYEGEIDVR